MRIMSISTLYQRIQSSQLVPRDKLEEVFQATYQDILARLGINPSDVNDSSTIVQSSHAELKSSDYKLEVDNKADESNEFLTLDSINNELKNDIHLELHRNLHLVGKEEQLQDSIEIEAGNLANVNTYSTTSANEEGSITLPRLEQNLDPSNLLTPELLSEFESLLLEKLLEQNLINSWQGKNLKLGRRSFKLGGYRIIDLLGEGGNGKVFLGRNPEIVSNVDKSGVKFKGDVAIKTIPIKKTSPESIGQFLLECEISKRLSHPNIIKCFSYAQEHTTHYSISEYVNAGDARKLLAQHLNNGMKLNFRAACYIVFEVAKGLEYLHKQGLIHRDVKPGNILLMKTGEVKLGDFGLSCPMLNFSPMHQLSPLGKFIDSWERENSVLYFGSYEERIKQRKKVRGTPDYLSPDQLRDPQTPVVGWDIYSLGCTLYFLLTGIVPYPSNDSVETLLAHMKSGSPPEPNEFDSAIPQKLSDVTMAMIQKAPTRSHVTRVDSMSQVIDLLSPWVDKQQIDNFITWKLSTSDNFWSFEKLESCFSDQQYKHGKEQSAKVLGPPNYETYELKKRSNFSVDSHNNNNPQLDFFSCEQSTSQMKKTPSSSTTRRLTPLDSLDIPGNLDNLSSTRPSLIDLAYQTTKKMKNKGKSYEASPQERELVTNITQKEKLNRQLVQFLLFPLLGVLGIVLIILLFKIFL